MKNYFILSLCIIAVICFCVACDDGNDSSKSLQSSYTSQEITGEIEYTLNGGGNAYSVTGIGDYTGKEIDILNTYNNLPVTDIAAQAFENSDITKVVIPQNVKRIGNNAFALCYNLEIAEIAEGVEEIGYSAFYACSSLKEINIPSTVYLLKSSAFMGCEEVTLIRYNAKSCSISNSNGIDLNHLFEDVGESGNGVRVIIGAEVKKIPSYLFSPNRYGYSPKITSVEFEDNSECETIGYASFSGCSSLQSVTIPESVTDIDRYAFYNCTSLTEINFNAIECQDFERGYYEGGNNDLNNYIFNNAGTNAEGLKVIFGSKVKRIPAYLFYSDNGTGSYRPKLTMVEFKENGVCKSIGEGAFYNCSLVESVFMPDSITFLDSQAFSGCSSLTNIALPSNLTQIESHVFSNCSSLTNITLPSNLTQIESHVFSNCSSLTNITLPSSLTQIGSGVFSGCSSLARVDYLGDINAWAQISFADQSSNPLCYAYGLYIENQLLTDIVLDTATKVSSFAFYNYNTLKTVIIGDKVEYIGRYAFSKCGNLRTVEIGEKVTQIQEYAFQGCSLLINANFKCVDGWRVGVSPSEYPNLQNQTTNANYLNKDYVGKTWFRTE